jgi:transposase
MMKQRRQYSDELKAEAVKMVTRDGLSLAEAARKLGIPKGSIGNWVAALKEDTPAAWPGAPSMAEVMAENAKLRKELAQAKMETEILKKATAYFAKESLPGMRS